MALELKQRLRMSQQLVMTPQLQQAIKLLQLSRLELVDLIRSEMEQNPLLEEPQEGAETELNEAPAELISTLNQSIEASELAAPAQEVAQPDLKKTNEGDVKREDIDWEQYLDNYQTQPTAPSAGGFNKEDLPSLQDRLTRGEDLTQHLMEHLRMAGLSDLEERIGALIIGNLNRDGYLVVDQELSESGTALHAVGKGTPLQGVPGTETVPDSPATNGVPANEPGTASDVVPREVPAVAPEALEALRRAQSPPPPQNQGHPPTLPPPAPARPPPPAP